MPLLLPLPAGPGFFPPVSIRLFPKDSSNLPAPLRRGRPCTGHAVGGGCHSLPGVQGLTYTGRFVTPSSARSVIEAPTLRARKREGGGIPSPALAVAAAAAPNLHAGACCANAMKTRFQGCLPPPCARNCVVVGVDSSVGRCGSRTRHGAVGQAGGQPAARRGLARYKDLW
jgi:hypothetical protein